MKFNSIKKRLNLIVNSIYFVSWREIKHYCNQKPRMIMSLVQPVVWLAFMGNMMAGLTDNPFAAQMLGVDNYLLFMTPGIMIMSSLFGGVFGGVSIIWDRQLGFLHKMLSAPIPRCSIPLGKMAAIGIQITAQMIIIITLASFLGVHIAAGPFGILLMLLFCNLFGTFMSGLSLSLATMIKNPETLFAVVNFLTLPLVFTSNAIFPREAMPAWLQVIARWNPITYTVTPMRSLAAQGWVWPDIQNGLAILLLFNIIILTVVVNQFEKGNLL